MKHIRSAPYKSQPLGACEQFNHTIRKMILDYKKANKTKQYVHVLPQLVYAYNNSVHGTTKKAPFEVFSRRESTFAIDCYVKTKTDFNAEKMKQRLTKKL